MMDNFKIAHWSFYDWGEIIEGSYKGEQFKIKNRTYEKNTLCCDEEIEGVEGLGYLEEDVTITKEIHTKYNNVPELLLEAHKNGYVSTTSIKNIKVYQ